MSVSPAQPQQKQHNISTGDCFSRSLLPNQTSSSMDALESDHLNGVSATTRKSTSQQAHRPSHAQENPKVRPSTPYPNLLHMLTTSQASHSKRSASSIDGRLSGKVKGKKTDAALKEANTIAWLADPHVYHGGESSKHREARLGTVIDQFEQFQLKEIETSTKGLVRKSQNRGQVVADQNACGLEGVGAWPAHRGT